MTIHAFIIVELKKVRQFVWHFHDDNQIEVACNAKDQAKTRMIKKITFKDVDQTHDSDFLTL